MELPFRLSRRERPAAADAYLLFADGFGPLARVFAHPGNHQPPAVYAVGGGFLVVPSDRAERALPGSVRLRRLAGDLFVPADADLVPALLPDEMVALTRDHGLVFLPGGKPLAFDARAPVPLEAWLELPPARRGDWTPFPAAPARADRLRSIEGPTQPVAVEVLAAGAPDGASPLPGAGEGSADGAAAPPPEDARPPSAGPVERLAGSAALGAGQFLAWLGRSLGAGWLARAGGSLARKAIEQVPRLTERVLGQQEAALLEVLRQLRSGDVEKGLRRAPVAVAEPGEPGRVATDARLGSRDPRYSLRDLIGGGGPGAGWLGGGDVWAQLANEYRRLAQEATRRGDYRRAAYLYGVLLRDRRSAANVLMAGGLHRDAAVVLRDGLGDFAGAAAAFEAAGDYNEALRLYEKQGLYVHSAELLRRLGEEERALEHFTVASEKLAGQGHWLAAGDLMRTKAGRSDRAAPYYRRGWESPSTEAVTCGERLLDEHLVSGHWDAVRSLLEEAGDRLAPPRSRDAGRFFNYAREAGAAFLPAAARDELEDRVRLLFADHLRKQRGSAAPLASELFGGTRWPGPVGRDARFAASRPSPAAEPLPRAPFRVAPGRVTAFAATRESFDVVVATTERVVCWRVGEGRVDPVATDITGVVGLAADATGRIVYVLHVHRDGLYLECYAADAVGAFRLMRRVRIESYTPGETGWYLQPAAVDRGGESIVTLASPSGRITFHGLMVLGSTEGFLPDGEHTRLLAMAGDCAWDWAGESLRCCPKEAGYVPAARWTSRWTPVGGSLLAGSSVDWISPAPRVLQVAGVDREGVAYWSEFDGRGVPSSQRVAAATHPAGFVAACLVAPARLAAVTGPGDCAVHWFRVAGTELKRGAPPDRLGTPAQAVGLVSRATASEVAAILNDGTIVRLPHPS